MNNKTALVGLLALAALLLGSCSQLPFLNSPGSGTPSPVSSPVPTDVPVQPTTSPLPTQQGVTSLVLWVPPQFDPDQETGAGELIREQLEAFEGDNPGLVVDVRVKSLEGTGSMLDALEAARAAAPRVLPDLVLLPRELMEEAAAAELIYPLEDSEILVSGEDWYPYAVSLSKVGGIPYGIPAAGDLLVLAYKSDVTEGPLADWEAVLETEKALAFPAADPGAVVTLALYESDGGELDRVDEAYTLDRVPMLNVLNFYTQAQAASVMPYWVAQFETDAQAWEAYRQRQATLALTWTSTYFQNGSLNTSLAPFPTRDGVPMTYGRGWAWAYTRSDPDRRDSAQSLVEALTRSDFLAAWSASSGYLPVRTSELQDWEGELTQEFLGKILPSARLVPSRRTLDDLGPPVREAVLSVIKDQMTPETVIEVLQLKLREGS